MLNGIKQSKEYRKVADFMLVAGKKRIDVYSASAAFYILMSFIPYVLIILSTIKYLPFTRDDLLKFINEILPLDINRLVVNIIDELYSGGIGVLSISIIAAVWASAKGIYAITKGLNEINDSANEKGIDKPYKIVSATALAHGMGDVVKPSVYGDSNCDGDVTIADAVLILQSIANPDGYQLSEQGRANADVVGNNDGVTANDALVIQMVEAGTYKAEDLPIKE